MIHSSRVALSLLIAGSLAACGSKPEAEAPKPATTAPLAEVQPEEQERQNPLALLDACTLEMSAPSYHEWQTRWDPAYARDLGANPSGVRSAHWASAEELPDLQQMGRAYPVEISCGSGPSAEYPIGVDLVATDSTVEDIPLGSGTYPIAPRSTTGKNKPGDIVVVNLQFAGAAFEAVEGGLTLRRFDEEGMAGSFVIGGREIGGEGRTLQLEGTFDMPCRIGGLQYGCKSEKAERE